MTYPKSSEVGNLIPEKAINLRGNIRTYCSKREGKYSLSMGPSFVYRQDGFELSVDIFNRAKLGKIWLSASSFPKQKDMKNGPQRRGISSWPI